MFISLTWKVTKILSIPAMKLQGNIEHLEHSITLFAVKYDLTGMGGQLSIPKQQFDPMAQWQIADFLVELYLWL